MAERDPSRTVSVDTDTIERLERLAGQIGETKAETIRRALEAYEVNMQRLDRNPNAPEWLKAFWKDHPLPLPTGLKADKAFFDELSGDL
jgi:antitoxin VapB